jgi:serine/threonine protein kinase
MKQEELLDQYDVNPQNDYTVIEKLEIALAMAESLAVLHGFKDGIIVHDDVQLCQWLRTRDNRLVLGDFNRAEVMDWNDEKQEYCMYNNGFAYGNYRSPEEFNGKDLNEKIDIFSYGNNVYGLLTGLWPFYENEDDDFAQRQVIDGKTSYIDDRYRERSYGEGKMVNLIEQCWQFKPEDRPDIFEIVRFLRRALEEEKFREGNGQQKQNNQ